MGLKDLKLPEEEVDVPGGKLMLRGLSLPDITKLAQHHSQMLSEIFNRFISTSGEEKEDFGLRDFSSLMPILLADAPLLVADIITLAAGESDAESRAIAARLPFPVQVQALEKVGRLTFSTEGDLKKVVETVTRMFESLGSSAKLLQAPSTSGDTTSES